MRQETAKMVFDTLMLELKKNDLTDVGVFVLENDNNILKENDIESVLDIFDYLNRLSLDNSQRALAYILQAGIDYFEKAKDIPKQYATFIDIISQENKSSNFSTDIYLKDQNFSERLTSTDVKSVLSLFKSLKASIDSEDDNLLEQLLNDRE